jgi:hypothetical protein
LLDGKVVEPKATTFSLSYHDEDSVGLKLIDDKPYFNPILTSLRLTSPGEVLIPKKDNIGRLANKYSLHLYVEKGAVEIKYNAKDNDPALLLYEGAKWNTRHFSREVEKIFVSSKENFVLNVIVEKLP